MRRLTEPLLLAQGSFKGLPFSGFEAGKCALAPLDIKLLTIMTAAFESISAWSAITR